MVVQLSQQAIVDTFAPANIQMPEVIMKLLIDNTERSKRSVE
jgi:hypothetical protein